VCPYKTLNELSGHGINWHTLRRHGTIELAR
jgi:hypothetical protein